MNNRKRTAGRTKSVQIIERWADVECPIYGNHHRSKPNVGSAYSTHDLHGNAYTIRKIVSRKAIHHKNISKI